MHLVTGSHSGKMPHCTIIPMFGSKVSGPEATLMDMYNQNEALQCIFSTRTNTKKHITPAKSEKSLQKKRKKVQ